MFYSLKNAIIFAVKKGSGNSPLMKTLLLFLVFNVICKEDREPAKRGRGTSKTAVIGAVERGGQVVAEVARGLTGRDIMRFIRHVVNVKESELMTDEYHAYNALSNQKDDKFTRVLTK